MQDFVRVNNKVVLGRQPSGAELDRLRQAGIKTVIDFRHPSETSVSNGTLAAAAGLDYVNIPIKANTISAADVAALDEVLRDKEGPFLLHCAAGPRAAGLYFLREAQQNGWTAEQALAESARAGFDLAGMPWLRSFLQDQLDRHERSEAARRRA